MSAPLPFLIAQTAATSAAAAPATDPASTLWNVLVSGGWAMVPLAALLFIGTLLVVVYFLTLRRGNVVTRRFFETTDALLRKRDYLGLLALSNRHGESAAHVVQRALDFATKNPAAPIETVREIAETEALRQASALQNRISYLADVGTIAPMVGLLGTVSGMIHSFGSISHDVATSKPMELAAGVSEALVCTAAGLVIGIFAFTFYAYFRGRVQRLIADLEAASTQFLALFALHYTPGGGSPAPLPGGASGRSRPWKTISNKPASRKGAKTQRMEKGEIEGGFFCLVQPLPSSLCVLAPLREAIPAYS